VKTRIQVKRLPKGVPDTPLLVTMYRLAQQEGFAAFYKGLGTTMLVIKYTYFYLNSYVIYFLGLCTELGYLFRYIQSRHRYGLFVHV
jgi:hypothetical protein